MTVNKPQGQNLDKAGICIIFPCAVVRGILMVQSFSDIQVKILAILCQRRHGNIQTTLCVCVCARTTVCFNNHCDHHLHGLVCVHVCVSMIGHQRFDFANIFFAFSLCFSSFFAFFLSLPSFFIVFSLCFCYFFAVCFAS